MDPVVPPKRPRKEVMAEYWAWIEENSKPRVYAKPKYPSRGPRVRIEEIAGKVAEMAKPAEHNKYKKQRKQPTVKREALNYTASARIIEIALPRVPYQKPVIPPLVKPSALKYELTKDTERLAVPRAITKKYRPRRRRVPCVSKKALKYTASARIIQIAKPMIKVDNNTRENPFSVSKKALRYKPSKRILEISKPKNYGEQTKKRTSKREDEDDED